MSAITGIYLLKGKQPDPSLVNRMVDTLAYRGPDGRAAWQAGPVGLGHCMLHTTPESLHEHLPLTGDDGRLTTTADARIDNREGLISDLNLGKAEGIIPDSALILHAYQRWGEDCVNHLLGDFAFAIWDQTKQQLFCARDHMGVRPFYYYCSDEFFVFASEIKALFCIPGVPKEVNEKTLAFRLAGIDADPATTSYLRICRLPPANTLIVSPSGTRITRYWSLDPDRELHFATDDEYKKAFRNLFTDAVRCRMRSAFPIGSTLSGGLDSSSVVVVARHILRQAKTNQPYLFHTFSAVFDEAAECDERTWIQHVIAGGDLTPHFIYPETISPLNDIRHRILQNEDPSLFPTSFTYKAIFEAAKDTGVRIVLSGEWGDGVVSYGRGALLEFILSGKIVRSMREIIRHAKKFRRKKREIIQNDLLLPIVPDIFRRRSDHIPMKWIRDDFARRTGLVEYFTYLRNTELNHKTSRECHFYDLSTYPVSLTLEEFNKNSAAHSVEISYPFLDRRIIEFCLALPPDQRIYDGYTRAIERESLAGYLPPEIRRRTSKATADPYIRNGLVRFEGKNLEELVFRHPEILSPYVDLDFIQETYRKLMAGTGVNVIPLWRAVIAAYWLQQERPKMDEEENCPASQSSLNLG